MLPLNCFDTVTSNVNFFVLQWHHRYFLRGSIHYPCFFSTIIPILFIILHHTHADSGPAVRQSSRRELRAGDPVAALPWAAGGAAEARSPPPTAAPGSTASQILLSQLLAEKKNKKRCKNFWFIYCVQVLMQFSGSMLYKRWTNFTLNKTEKKLINYISMESHNTQHCCGS